MLRVLTRGLVLRCVHSLTFQTMNKVTVRRSDVGAAFPLLHHERPPALLCLFSRQLLINSSQGISCSPPSLPCFCSKWNGVLALFTAHE